jgi:hypothetical protein
VDSCPISGRNLENGGGLGDALMVTGAAASGIDDLLDHLERTTSLERAEAARVVADVLAFFSETVEEYVRRRHRELARAGLRNDAAFERIAHELDDRRVAPPELSLRQIRRVIYG